MGDGFKWTVTGGVVGIIIILLGATVINRLGAQVKEIRMDWFVTVSMPLLVAVLVWYANFTNKVKADQIKSIFEKIETKASDERVTILETKLGDHKEADTQKTADIYKAMSSMEKKMDMILEKLLKV